MFVQGFFIFIGVVWQLTSATVIYGVRKRSQPAICCFVISLLIMFIVEFAVGIAAAVVLKVCLTSASRFDVSLPATERSLRYFCQAFEHHGCQHHAS
jgi:MFS superfamily sulfate permease-like transporter